MPASLPAFFLRFPEVKGFSPRNLKYMRALAEAYPDCAFVQQVVAQIWSFYIPRRVSGIVGQALSPANRALDQSHSCALATRPALTGFCSM